MKNRRIELLKAKAKEFHRYKRGSQFDDGVLIYHSYGDRSPTDLSYWDRATFVVNNYRVSLLWLHPRYQYLKRIAEEASKRVEHHEENEFLFELSAPNYKKLGHSRKRLASYTAELLTDEKQEGNDIVDDAKLEVAKSVSFEVRPSLQINWRKSCKSIWLCAPFEVRSEEDLKKLVDIARRLVMRQSTLVQEFGDYVYMKEEYWAENARHVSTTI